MDNTDFRTKINNLSEHHRKNCKAYDDICNGLTGFTTIDDRGGTFLPVSIFKSIDLVSVPVDQVKSRLTSSGTTGQSVSRIHLDGETAADQQRALCEIVGEYIGEKRIPMLIIDSPDVLRDRKKYSARGAGIMGFSMMASKRYYALDSDMNLDWDSIKEFQAKAEEGPTFAFGFTYMIWAYFYNALKRGNKALNLKNCFLIHGGGWKKLQNQSVSNEAFKAGLKEVCGIDHVSNYYGMAEQTGSIFMECAAGHLHPSDYSNITALNPEDFSPCEIGEWGLLALESTLPKSYPGHRLMTEDWGRILGEDDCPCGRRGKYFEIQGRIKRAEIRGCSDTFAKSAEADSVEKAKANAPTSILEKLNVLAGNFPVEIKKRNAFDSEVMDFIEELSELLIKEYRSFPEITALGFWCRKAHMKKLEKRQRAREYQSMTSDDSDKSENPGKGRGMVLHIAPSNMPTMFAYSWITALLAGNSNVVRISARDSEMSKVILEAIDKVLGRYDSIRKTNAFVQFERDDSIIEALSAEAAGRIIWGGDETVEKISSIAAGEKSGMGECVDICFPDKYSIAVLDCEKISKLSDEELKYQVGMFYNDTYGADQNACSSPKSVFWINGNGSNIVTTQNENTIRRTAETAKTRWWDALAKETRKYDFQPWMATEKYRMLCCAYAENHNLRPVKMWGNRLYVIPCSKPERPLWRLEGSMGMFYEYDIDGVQEISNCLDEKIQTVVTNVDGLEMDVDRIVSIGEALDFDTIWDRKDIIAMLTERA